jgi:hypothetical protein
LEVARKAAEAEIGTSHYAAMAFLAAPQAAPAEQEILRRAAAFNGFTLLDLPASFKRELRPALPGRKFFLDYCHLTIQGMAFAMGEVTSAVIDMKDEKVRPLLKMLEGTYLPDLPNEAVATAHFGAAIHNAHRLSAVTDKQELLVYWCLQSLADSPDIYQTMIDFVAARSQPYPAVMTAEQQHLFNSPYLLQHPHGWKYNHMDAAMIQAIIAALEEWEPKWAKEAVDVLVKNAALGSEALSLLKGYYDAEPLRRFFPEIIPTPDMTGWGIYRAAWPESKFCFVMAGSADLTLDVSARSGKYTKPESTAALFVNDKQVGEFLVGTSWLRHEIVVGGRFIHRGLNKLAIQWPYPVVKKEEVWGEIIGRLEQGLEAAIHPVFGEFERLHLRKVIGNS